MQKMVVFLLFGFVALTHADEPPATMTELGIDIKSDAPEAPIIADASEILQERSKRVKLWFLPGQKAGTTVQTLIYARKCETVTAEADDGEVRVYKHALAFSKAFPKGGEVTWIEGKLGAKVVVYHTFADPPKAQRTRLVLGGVSPGPDPDDPIVPPKPKPDLKGTAKAAYEQAKAVGIKGALAKRISENFERVSGMIRAGAFETPDQIQAELVKQNSNMPRSTKPFFNWFLKTMNDAKRVDDPATAEDESATVRFPQGDYAKMEDVDKVWIANVFTLISKGVGALQ